MIRVYVSSSRTFLYADDTLIIEANCEVAQACLDSIRKMGALYGLQLNNSKLEVLRKDEHLEIITDSGVPVKRKTSILYLGSLLSADSRP